MGKRVADKQLTDRNWDEDDEGDESEEGAATEPGQFARAPEAEIAGRKIRGLPNRKAASSSPLPAPTPAAPLAASNPFGGAFSFGSSATTTGTNPFASFGAPAPASTSTSTATTTTSNTTNGSGMSTSAKVSAQAAAVKHYKDIRAINLNLLDTLQSKLNDDPFVNLEPVITALLPKYKDYWAKSEAEYESAKKSTPAPAEPPSKSNEKAESAPPVPVAPQALSFAGQPVKTTAPSKPVEGGFVFNPASSSSSSTEKSAFSFPAATSTPAPSTSKPAPFNLLKSHAPAAPSPLRQSVSPPPESPPKAASSTSAPSGQPKPLFSFGASASTPTASVAAPSFGFGASAPGFGGASSSTPSFGFGAALGSKKTEGGAASTGFSFGASSPSFSFGAAPASTSSASDSKPVFSFGATPSVSVTPADNGEDKSGKSGSKPAAFSFGGSGAFSFGAPAAGSAPSSGVTTPALTDSPGASETEDGAAAAAANGDEAEGERKNPLVGQGEGEEGEETLHSVQGKVFKIVKEDGKLVNKDQGVCTISIKESSSSHDDGKQVRRLLARNSTTGHVAINFRLQPSFSAKVESKFLTFTGFETTQPMNYRIRVKTADEASELNNQLEKAKQA